MDLKQLEYFVCVAERGSFSRAAIALNLAQPSLSRQVALLEAELGQRLLERTGRGVMLTQAGAALLTHAKAMLASADQVKHQIQEMRTDPSGRVVVGLPHRVAMGLCEPLIRAFRQRFPHALISVVEGLSLSLTEGLINGQLDVALLFDPAPTPLLRCETLLRERLMLFAPARSRLPTQVSLQALKEYPMVLPSRPNPIRALVDAVLLPRKISLALEAEVGAVHTAITLVEAGMACSILPESAIRLSTRPSRIKFAPIGPPAMWNHLALALPASRPMSKLTLETSALLRAIDFRAPNPP